MQYCFDSQLRYSIERILLPDVQLPGQYIGGEVGQIVKPADSVACRFCFAFPDTYSIGMSNYGLQLLYSLVNREPDLAFERVFCPYPDMEAILRRANLPLYSLETFTPLACFDVVGFTFQYEMAYTNVLTMLSLGRIPLHRTSRRATDPLVIAGGPGVFNPEPMSNFIDLFVIGDGEESLPLLCRYWQELKENAGIDRHTSSESVASVDGLSSPQDDFKEFSSTMIDPLRREMLLAIARKFPWVYVPEFYEVPFDEGQRTGRPRPKEEGVSEYIQPALIKSLDSFPPPTHPLIPLVESVQDRISLEIMRGCPNKCRFCQSSPIKRPLRVRSAEQIIELAKDSSLATGIRDMTLLSLSSSEYPHFENLLERLRETICPMGVSLAVPSLRVNHQLSEIVRGIAGQRSTGITVAPEVALDEMRHRIAKKITNEDLIAGCRAAFENGFGRIKMYFMCGFPNESQEDIDGIIRLCDKVAYHGKEIRNRFPAVTANVSNFVPKPQTPLQWAGMASPEYLRQAHDRLKYARRLKCVDLKYHDLRTSLLESLLARGDRRVGAIIELAWRKGARLDAWNDFFRYEHWVEAIKCSGINQEDIVHRTRSTSEELPWDHITTAVSRNQLIEEYEAFCQ